NVTTSCATLPTVLNECAMLIAGWVENYIFDFYSNSYSLNVAGILWFGDLNGRSVRAHMNNSNVVAGGIQVKENSIVWWDNATVVSYELLGQGSQAGYSQQADGSSGAGP